MKRSVISQRNVLAVKDLNVTASYFIDKLGFERDFAVSGMEFLSFGDFKVLLRKCPDAMPVGDTGDHSYVAYALVEDVDALFQEMKKNGAEFHHEAPVDQPWGVRDFLVVTPDGHYIKYGQIIQPDE